MYPKRYNKSYMDIEIEFRDRSLETLVRQKSI